LIKSSKDDLTASANAETNQEQLQVVAIKYEATSMHKHKSAERGMRTVQFSP
jgi:hypothetical protein